MKLAFLISMALILPIFSAYFIINASPLQNGKMIELSENVGVNDELKTHITHHTQSIELKRYYCNSVAEGFNKDMKCNV